jgi:ABC-2 type transport system permease protein
MIFLIVAGMAKYSASSAAGPGSMNELIAQMPKSLQNLMGIGVFDLSVAMDYFGVLFLYIALVAAVHAVMLGAGIISKEERDKTVEFLMVKPVSRQYIITSKLLASFTMILFYNIITFAVSFLMISYYSKSRTDSVELLKLMTALLALQIFFVVMGAFLAALINRPKLSSAVSTGVLLMMFMLSVIADIVGNIDFLKYFTVFKYFDAKDILKGGYEFIYPVLTVILSVLFFCGTYFFYKKRDLKI